MRSAVRGLRAMSLGEKTGLAGFLTAAAFFVFLLSTLLNPYHPLDYDKVEPIEPAVCGSSSVAVFVEYETDPLLYDTIAEVRVKSEWIAVDVPGVNPGTRYGAAESVLYPEDLGRGRVKDVGAALRVAPDRPGLWLLFNTYVAKSKRSVFPPRDTFTVGATEPTTVLAVDHPDCRKER